MSVRTGPTGQLTAVIVSERLVGWEEAVGGAWKDDRGTAEMKKLPASPVPELENLEQRIQANHKSKGLADRPSKHISCEEVGKGLDRRRKGCRWPGRREPGEKV